MAKDDTGTQLTAERMEGHEALRQASLLVGAEERFCPEIGFELAVQAGIYTRDGQLTSSGE